MPTPDQKELRAPDEEAVGKTFDTLVPPGKRTDPDEVRVAMEIAAKTKDLTPDD